MSKTTRVMRTCGSERLTVKVTGPDGNNPITDEQILDVQAAAEARGDRNLVKTAGRALQEPHTAVWEHCRRLCAIAWNIHHGAEADGG
jgi:hypothetical protein